MTGYTGNDIKLGDLSLAGQVADLAIGSEPLSSEAYRTMDGTYNMTMIGNFPKLTIKMRNNLTSEQVAAITAKLDNPPVSVTYPNPKTGITRTADFYASAYTPEILDLAKGTYKSFDITLVAYKKEQ